MNPISNPPANFSNARLVNWKKSNISSLVVSLVASAVAALALVVLGSLFFAGVTFLPLMGAVCAISLSSLVIALVSKIVFVSKLRFQRVNFHREVKKRAKTHLLAINTKINQLKTNLTNYEREMLILIEDLRNGKNPVSTANEMQRLLEEGPA